VVANQDAAAFGELIRRHQSQVRNFLRKLARDETLADDLAQDCFLHAWDKIHTYSGTGSFIGWVLKIAYTTFLQSKRKSKRYYEILEQAGQEPDRSATTGHNAPETELDLDTLLAALNEQERVIMIFSYACGLSHREISEATEPAGIGPESRANSRRRLQREDRIEDPSPDLGQSPGSADRRPRGSRFCIEAGGAAHYCTSAAAECRAHRNRECAYAISATGAVDRFGRDGICGGHNAAQDPGRNLTGG
jgi:RNA polymerase sigma-70 factor (ECF subfamily)